MQLNPSNLPLDGLMCQVDWPLGAAGGEGEDSSDWSSEV